jgi:hypothetical protein
MTEASAQPGTSSERRPTELHIGGLHFTASFRGAGATLRVYGPAGGRQTELLRFDDFIDEPHYHVPADGPQIQFDRDGLGAPLDSFVAQIRDNLGEMLATGGFTEALAVVDLRAVADNADQIDKMMRDCVPAGYGREPGVGLRKVDA